MKFLSDFPTLVGSDSFFEIPFTMRHMLQMVGYHEIELEHVAKELLKKHGDWQTCYEEMF